MKQLSAVEVNAHKIAELGLDPETHDLLTPEALAGALRRAASHLCPCPGATLVRSVLLPLRGLVPDLAKTREALEGTLQVMIAHGDLIEQADARDGSTSARTLVYAAPVSFVVRQSGLILILGVADDRPLPLPPELATRVEHRGHIRRLVTLSPNEDLSNELRQLGLYEVSYTAWLKGPSATTASQILAVNDRALDSVPASRDIPGLSLLDPTKPVHYYQGRWTEPKAHTGRFVGRRAQAYGPNLWCYVQLQNGLPERMIDLPHRKSRWRGCDEAWHLQLAIDAQRGEPQRLRLTSSGEAVIFEFFSPVPAWARRRWDAVGEPVSTPTSLFAYRIPRSEVDEERRFTREALWLEEVAAPNRAR